MRVEEALKYVNAHFIIQNFLARYNYLFSDTAFKVISVMLTDINYKLENTLCSLSYNQIAQMVKKEKRKVQNAINELIEKRFIVKISGKYHKELALRKKTEIYKQKQRSTLATNEKNVYDFKNLILIVATYEKLVSIYPYQQYKNEVDYIIEYIVATATKNPHITIEEIVSPIWFTTIKDQIGICFVDLPFENNCVHNMSIQNRQYRQNIHNMYEGGHNMYEGGHNMYEGGHNMYEGGHNMYEGGHNMYEGGHNMYEGGHNMSNTISSNIHVDTHIDTNTYTHSLYIKGEEEKNESEREKNKDIEKEKKEKDKNNKEESTHILTQAHKKTNILGKESNSLFITQTQKVNCELEDKRFWLFVRADLKKKEALGLIRSAEAVMASLVEKPNKVSAIYYPKYKEYESKIKEAELCVLKFKQSLIEDVETRLLNYVFDTDVEQMIEQKMNTGAMICEDGMYAMVVVGEYCEECLERATEIGIELIKDDYLKYENVFINRVLNVFFPSEDKKSQAQRKNKSVYHYDDGEEEETYHG